MLRETKNGWARNGGNASKAYRGSASQLVIVRPLTAAIEELTGDAAGPPW